MEQAPPAQQSVDPQAEREPSPERAASPEARWNDKAGRVNLYSENVVQEPQSTDVVNRESIANLATTRRQWESIFTSEPEESNPKPKKNPPKWQVRLPYAEKTHTSPATVTSNASTEPESPSPSHTSNMAEADTESAIEREIRLAMEREAMLKREQEERLRQQSQRGFQVSSMESSTESELQPSFHELTEADRGSEFFINERVVQQEDAEQEESLQRGFAHQVRSSEGNTSLCVSPLLYIKLIRVIKCGGVLAENKRRWRWTLALETCYVSKPLCVCVCARALFSFCF